jgi:TRAP-type mannitol/chloroaromatic compound transport system substrate-binding protein
MKKTILFVLVLSILMLIPMNVFAEKEELYNYRNTWNGWTEYQKYVYLWGFKDGLHFETFHSLTAALEVFTKDMNAILDQESEKQLKFLEKTTADFYNFNLEIIRSIMNDLYNDAANSYISFDQIIEIANKKLLGFSSIENMLENARKEVIRMNDLMNEIKKRNP